MQKESEGMSKETRDKINEICHLANSPSAIIIVNPEDAVIDGAFADDSEEGGFVEKYPLLTGCAMILVSMDGLDEMKPGIHTFDRKALHSEKQQVNVSINKEIADVIRKMKQLVNVPETAVEDGAASIDDGDRSSTGVVESVVCLGVASDLLYPDMEKQQTCRECGKVFTGVADICSEKCHDTIVARQIAGCEIAQENKKLEIGEDL